MSNKRLLYALVLMAFAVPLVFAAGEQESTAASGEPKIFTFAVNYDPPSIDVQKNYAGFGEQIGSHLHEGLVALDENMSPIPGLAERWEISPDGKTYTFYLRDGLKWSDGKPITTKDFYYAWQRLLKPETGSKYTNMGYAIVNAEAIAAGEKDPSELGVRIIDERTIEIRLVGPLPYMLQNFAHGAFMPMREDVISANPDGWAIDPATNICSGPFVLKAYGLNDRIILARNPNYYDVERVKLDEIHFVTIPTGSTALAAYSSGEIDGFTFIPSSEIPRLMATTDELHLSPRVRSMHLYINLEAEPLNNPKVREALSRAIDRTEIAQVLGVGRSAATGYVPFGLVAEGEDFRKVGGDLGLSTKADPERARKLLAEAGYPNGEGFPKIEVAITSGYSTWIEAIQEMWRENLGIQIDIQVVEGGVLSSMRKSRDFQIAAGGWSANIFHPSYYINQLDSTGTTNYPGYNNPEFDALISRARTEPDPKKVLDLLHQAEEIAIGQDFALFPIFYETSKILIKNYATGWYSDPIGRFWFKYVDIEK